MQVLWIRNQIVSHIALYHITLHFIILYHTSCHIIVTTLYYVALNCIKAQFSHRALFISGCRWSGQIKAELTSMLQSWKDGANR